ncbi:NifB/NifX family molybdenum-iron cluster-binding protein [Thiomicrorhabdus sp.]|uniref:NifB/NifX family molybdenum-iron cluster-binding protein n=1 Tax=Thiomicrorhabdus sp. TaxID=2039724 RepID=UPI0029C8DFDF|nr:NifB/NifX family molybdenum-iron cluster-binding protein [Thiomicrorhabdus sp.]
MKLAISSPNGRTISGHAGKCPGYLLYELDHCEVKSKTHCRLNSDQLLCNLQGSLSQHPEHPLSGIKLLITHEMGNALHDKLNHDGIRVLMTDLADPDEAVSKVIKILQT